ncbi:MAG TPA: hypothetical protein VGO00_21495 [Kofleriaceae bacterium]|nr:hypothetical protein [Kofleriaceae bacterium]
MTMANNDIQIAPEHEFDATENEVFSGVSGAMRFVAAVTIILGVLYVVVGVFSLSSPIDAVVNLGQGVCMLLIGVWLYGAGNHFKDIVITEGNDITNLMFAIKKLKNVYTLQAWLLGLAIALVVLGIIFYFGLHPR